MSTASPSPRCATSSALHLSNEISSLIDKIKACELSLRDKDVLLNLMQHEAQDASKEVLHGFAEDMKRIAKARRRYG